MPASTSAYPGNRAQREARRHRVHHRGGGKHGRGGRSRRVALAALRAHVERHRRYRAGVDGAQRIGSDSQGHDRSRRGVEARAFEFKDTVQIGRTHGIHAEPITFGSKLALWYDEVQRNLARFSAAAEGMRVGKISGAVGTFGHIGPQAEERICQRLGLRPAADRFAGDLARSSRQLRRDPGADCRHARKDRPRNPPPAAHRSARSGRAVSRRAKKDPRRCRTSGIR